MGQLTNQEERVIITKLIHKLNKPCRDEHIQIASYLIRYLFDVPLSYNFCFIQKIPFSYLLGDEIISMTKDGFLSIRLSEIPYRYNFDTTELAEELWDNSCQILMSYKSKINLVSQLLETKKYDDLVGLSLSLYVVKFRRDAISIEDKAKVINELNNNISIESALNFIQELNVIINIK